MCSSPYWRGDYLPARRDAARKIGMVLALGTRLALLGSIAWLVHLTEQS